MPMRFPTKRPHIRIEDLPSGQPDTVSELLRRKNIEAREKRADASRRGFERAKQNRRKQRNNPNSNQARNLPINGASMPQLALDPPASEPEAASSLPIVLPHAGETPTGTSFAGRTTSAHNGNGSNGAVAATTGRLVPLPPSLLVGRTIVFFVGALSKGEQPNGDNRLRLEILRFDRDRDEFAVRGKFSPPKGYELLRADVIFSALALGNAFVDPDNCLDSQEVEQDAE